VLISDNYLNLFSYSFVVICLQCFDAVTWVAEKASSL